MINKPESYWEEQTNSNESLSMLPYIVEVDFLAQWKTEQEVYDEIRSNIIEEARKIEDLYDIQRQYTVHFVCEILKNVRFHGGGKGYVVIQPEKVDLIWEMLHFAVGDYGPGMPLHEGFDIQENFLGKEWAFQKAPRKGERVEGCHGVGWKQIQSFAEEMNMHLIMYNNGIPFLLNDVLREYKRVPKDRNINQWVHFVGSIVTTPQKTPINTVDINFNQNHEGLRAMYNTIFDPLSRMFSEDGSSTEISSIFLNMLAEILKNIQDHGGGIGYFKYYIEENKDLSAPILHFMVGDNGKGIAHVAWSHENFYQDGYSTGTPWNNFGRWGARVKKVSQKLNIAMKMYDNGEMSIIHPVDTMPASLFEEPPTNKGTHFIGSLILNKDKE